jgi:hypothetical protein
MGWTGLTSLSFLASHRGFGIRASVRVFRGHARRRYQRQPAARGARSLDLEHVAQQS